MRNFNITFVIAATLALTACGGGGGSSPDSGPVTVAPPPVTNPPVSTPPPAPTVPTMAETFASIAAHFGSDVLNMNYSRFDILPGDRMLVAYSPDTADATLVLVDYSDRTDVTYTELGTAAHHRGVVKADFDHDEVFEAYTYSHGYEFVRADGSVDMNSDGDNHFISEDGTVTRIGGGYTHGACAGDVNGDTHVDIIDVNAYYNTPLVRYNDGTGSFGIPVDMPLEVLEADIDYTACTSADVNGDGFDDVVFGRNADANNVQSNHLILFGSADGLVYNSSTSVIEYSSGEFTKVPSTTGLFVTGNYMVAFVTDYDTTQVELFEFSNGTYQFVEAARVDVDTLDIEVSNGVGVIHNSWTWALESYHTEAVYHVAVVDGRLNIDSRVRSQ